MRLSSVFHVSVYGLSGLAALLLIAGTGEAFPEGGTLPLVVLALFFNERWQVIRLNPLAANFAAVLAVVATAIEFFGEAPESRLLAGVHLLVYLSWIVLFLDKTDRQYWWLCTLGVLQIAVGAVMVEPPWDGLFGVMLVGYMVAGIWTLSVFSLFQARRRVADEIGPFPDEESVPLSRRAMVVQGGIQLDPSERWISVRFLAGVLGTSLGALGVSMVFFLLIPRYWLTSRLYAEEMVAGMRPLTGYADEVQLGEIGQILQSTEHVLEVRLTDRQTGASIDVEDYSIRLGQLEPMFRGRVLSEYRNGRWPRRLHLRDRRKLSEQPAAGGGVRQEIRIETTRTDVLFAMFPVEACRIDEPRRRAWYHPVTNTLVRQENGRGPPPLRYSVYSMPITAPADAVRDTTLDRIDRTAFLQLPRRGVEQLVAEAQVIARYEDPSGRPPPGERARLLLRWLRDSGQFAYSLDARIEDPKLDPVEDFLVNRREGHCEYFATSLALMLRAVDVPSRMVIGFKGGNTNRFSGQFVVEQRHAHAWVEAHVDGRWITLDPTPVERTMAVRRMAPESSLWRDLGQVISLYWHRYVLGLSLRQQRTLFYRPVEEQVSGGVSAARDLFDRAVAGLQATLVGPGGQVRWSGALLWVLLAVGAGLVARRGRSILAWLASRRRVSGPGSLRRRRVVAFYERFRQLLARRGMVRVASQTPMEFAGEIEAGLAEQLGPAGLEHFPGRLTRTFYAVRYGDLPLEDDELERLSRLLDTLEHCLRESAGRPDSTIHFSSLGV